MPQLSAYDLCNRGYEAINDPPIEPVYPVENILGVFSGLQFLTALRTIVAGRAAVNVSSKRIRDANKPLRIIWVALEDIILVRQGI